MDSGEKGITKKIKNKDDKFFLRTVENESNKLLDSICLPQFTNNEANDNAY